MTNYVVFWGWQSACHDVNTCLSSHKKKTFLVKSYQYSTDVNFIWVYFNSAVTADATASEAGKTNVSHHKSPVTTAFGWIPFISLWQHSSLIDTQELNCITRATVSFPLPTSASLALDNGKAFHTWDGPRAIWAICICRSLKR